MQKYLSNIPCGLSLPFDNPHAVSVSLPTMSDIIGYEEGLEAVTNRMQSGYPRFFTKELVRELVSHIRDRFNIGEEFTILPVASIRAKEIVEFLVQQTLEYVEDDENAFIIFKKEDPLVSKCRDLIRNTGLLISSRKAESTLAKRKLVVPFHEKRAAERSSNNEIRTVLGTAYSANASEILLTNSGMNAVFAACETVTQIKKEENRNIIVQLGWLYLDSMEIIEKRSEAIHIQIDIADHSNLENWLEENHAEVAFIFTEAVTNPLIHCVDLPWLSALSKKYGLVLILDTTLATPYNADLLKYCDIAVESLTKFASGGGDVMMGAVVFNAESPLSAHKNRFSAYIIAPFEADSARLAFQITGYEDRVRQVSANTKILHEYLSKQAFVTAIHSVLNEQDAMAFSKIRKSEDHTIGLISILFDRDLHHYYDHLHLPKGPTLGTEFTIAMPYVYLAHYDLIRSENGRARLKSLGLNPELLRISVGIEPIEEIIAVFERLKDRSRKPVAVGHNFATEAFYNNSK